MNREIKFRTWNPKHKYFYFWGFNTEIDGKPYFVGTPSGGGFISDEIFKHTEQFTGLYDKNSKEIYEGDILKNPRYEESYVVEYHGDGYVGWGDDRRPGCYLITDEDIEIIGNIHENPELIK